MWTRRPTPPVLLGCCTEHTDRPIRILTAENVTAALDSVESGGAHLAHLTEVLAVSSLGGGRATATPILGAASCGTFSAPDIVELVNAARSGGAGHAWGICSDGAANYRKAGVLLCRTETISPTSPVGLLLIDLLGLDMHTGKDLFLHFGDIRHLWKRFFCSLTKGICIEGVHLTPVYLAHAVATYAGVPSAAATNMFIGIVDKMRVAPAERALAAVAALHSVPAAEFATAASAPNRVALRILADVAAGLLSAADPTTGLAAQLRRLAKLGFILGAAFDRDSSFNAQWYHDIQRLVANAFKTAARAIVHAATTGVPFRLWLDELGSDNLEALFAVVRTLDHSRTFDLWELQLKLGIAIAIADVFERHPDWERSDRRRGRDKHESVQVGSVKGDITLTGKESPAHLPRLWQLGMEDAEALLRDCGIVGAGETSPLIERLQADTSLSLMMPAGRLVGVRSSTAASAAASADGVGGGGGGGEDDDDDDSDGYNAALAAEREAVFAAAQNDLQECEGGDIGDGSGDGSAVDLDALVEGAADAVLPAASSSSGVWLDVMGKRVHVSSLVCDLFHPVGGTRSSNDRLSRVKETRGFPTREASASSAASGVDGGPVLTVQDPVATLAVVGDRVALLVGVVESISVPHVAPSRGGSSSSSTPSILQLLPLRATTNGGDS